MSIGEQLSLTAIVFIFLSLAIFILSGICHENRIRCSHIIAYIGAAFMVSAPVLFLVAIWI